MSEYEDTLLMMHGVVASMPEKEQQRIKEAYTRIREMETELSSTAVLMAVSIIGAEESAK